MLRKVLVAGVCSAVGVVIGAAAFSASAAPSQTVHVIEHANTDTVVDTGASGDTTGDLLTFHNPVFDSNNSAKVGHDRGDCVRISPASALALTRSLSPFSARPPSGSYSRSATSRETGSETSV